MSTKDIKSVIRVGRLRKRSFSATSGPSSPDGAAAGHLQFDPAFHRGINVGTPEQYIIAIQRLHNKYYYSQQYGGLPRPASAFSLPASATPPPHGSMPGVNGILGPRAHSTPLTPRQDYRNGRRSVDSYDAAISNAAAAAAAATVSAHATANGFGHRHMPYGDGGSVSLPPTPRNSHTLEESARYQEDEYERSMREGDDIARRRQPSAGSANPVAPGFGAHLHGVDRRASMERPPLGSDCGSIAGEVLDNDIDAPIHEHPLPMNGGDDRRRRSPFSALSPSEGYHSQYSPHLGPRHIRGPALANGSSSLPTSPFNAHPTMNAVCAPSAAPRVINSTIGRSPFNAPTSVKQELASALSTSNRRPPSRSPSAQSLQSLSARGLSNLRDAATGNGGTVAHHRAPYQALTHQSLPALERVSSRPKLLGGIGLQHHVARKPRCNSAPMDGNGACVFVTKSNATNLHALCIYSTKGSSFLLLCDLQKLLCRFQLP